MKHMKRLKPKEHGKVLYISKTNIPIAFMADHTIVFEDINGEKQVLLKDEIMVGEQTPFIFDSIRRYILARERES